MDKKINITNYEEFALDYIEGNLDSTSEKQFEEFLNQNPEIRSEIDDLFEFSIEVDEKTYENKFDLKKSGIKNISYYEYLCISDIENTITPKEKSELENIFRQNPELLNDYKQLIKAKLQQGRIIFSSKHELKKSGMEGISYLEYLFISKAEGTITQSEQTELNEITSNNSKLISEQKQFDNLKFIANKNITYPNKNKLKHTNIISFKTAVTVISALAAMFIIFFGLKTSFTNNNNQANQCISSFDISFYRNIIEEQKDSVELKKPTSNNNLHNNIIVEQEKTDTTFDNIENEFQNFTEEIVVLESPLEKNIDLKLSTINETIEFPIHQELTSDYYSNTNKTANIDKKIKAQDVVDFFVKQYNVLTENDVSLKVDIDKKNNCYGIELNDKTYDFCLSEKFASQKN